MTAPPLSRRDDILLLSTADWDNPFWTNKQHVAVELARRGHRVLYVDSLGLRRPTGAGRDVLRMARRLLKALAPPRQVRPNLWVCAPLVIPLHGAAWVRRANRLLLAAQLGLAKRLAGLRPTWLWTYSPLTPALLDLKAQPFVVYHSVDDVAAQPGMPATLIEAVEQDLVRLADVVFTTAPELQHAHAALNPQTHYFPNVADFDHFHAALSVAALPPDIAALPAPRIGFVGALSGYKQDFALIRDLALARPDYSIVLIGQIGEGEPGTDASALTSVENLHLLGPRAYADLPAYLAAMDVAILPSRRNRYTTSMFPMKFYEYLAAGRPVVSTRLPALADQGDLALFAEDAPAFAMAVDRALAGEGPSLERRLAAAREHTYAIRTERMLEVIDAIRRPPPPLADRQ